MNYTLDELDEDGWVWWSSIPARVQCCDCGMVHELTTRTRKGVFEIGIRRNDRASAAVRRSQAVKRAIGRLYAKLHFRL